MQKQHRNDILSLLSTLQNFKLKLMVDGIIVGIFSALLVIFYRVALEKAEEFRNVAIGWMQQDMKLIWIWFAFLLLGGYLVGTMVKKEPMISGSGIPQVEGILLGKIRVNWLSIIIRKVIGGIISIGAGLSLGREGPSIQLGAAVGQGIQKIFKRFNIEEKYLITSGASAGLSAAFNAPLAGVLFSLEEVHKHFSPLILLPAMFASLTADFISKHFFGLKPVFRFEDLLPLPLMSYGYVALLGVIMGCFGAFYNRILLKSQDLYQKQKWLPVRYRPLFPFLIAGVLALTFPQVLGGGHSIIESLIDGNFTLKILLMTLIIKFAFSMLSYGSGAPGGIFFPLLVLGALTGAIYGNLLVRFCGFSPEYIHNFIILAMAGYFTAIVRAPITGSILITEMTGSFSHLLSLSFISIIAYIVADLLKSEPIYESLLDRILKNNGEHELSENSQDKILLEIPVFIGSEMHGKAIKELKLPSDCLLVGIRRGEKEVIPRGNTKVYSGNYLLVLVDENKAAFVNEVLSKMSGYHGTPSGK